MADYPYFYDAVKIDDTYDRVYNADSFSDWLRKFFTDGVFNGDCKVTADGSAGMTVTVGSGYANIGGKVMNFSSTTDLTIATAPTKDRIDNIVIQRNDTDRQFYIKVVQGTYPASGKPVAPTRGTNELILAEVYVTAGATALTQVSITDRREDNNYCGYVIGTVDAIDISGITDQLKASFDAWFDTVEKLSDETAAGLAARIQYVAGNTGVSDSETQTPSHETRLTTAESNISDLTAKTQTTITASADIKPFKSTNSNNFLAIDLRRKGNVVSCEFWGRLQVPVNSCGALSEYTIPEGFRPPSDIRIQCTLWGGTSYKGMMVWVVNSSGGILVEFNSNTTDYVNRYSTVTWLTEDDYPTE